MNDASARWRQVEELCNAALERDPHDRSAFLAAACGGDVELRREVEALLAHAPAADGFLVEPVGALAADVMFGSNDARGSGLSGPAGGLIGRRIGTYQVVSRLGAGGMGEVYSARDMQLGRNVAIKVLPSSFTADRDRAARFEREARVLASLNHPHIGAIYGAEQIDGARALVLELVEGQTLAERIADGSRGLAIPEALAFARQIAEALEAAHDSGVIHRDLKPANIKITPTGIVKVLDFGLAKAASRTSRDASRSPTITATGAAEGVLLGTAAYMSPEQARGQAVDKRADIWAFGCVLYEMLTGRTVFHGDTPADHIAAILEREPDVTALPKATPPHVRRLIRRCLEKDPKHRVHDIADARIEIEEALSGPSLGNGDTAVGVPHQRPIRLLWSIAAIASLVTLAALGALMWNIRTPPQGRAAPRISRLTMGTLRATAVELNGARSLAITPDGTRVIYVGNKGTQLFVRHLDRLDPTAIVTAAAPLNWVFVSPDGQWVGFEEGATLKRVAITGGPITTIATPAGNTRGATWAPDDSIIIGTRDAMTGLQRVSAAGGELTVLSRPVAARGERAYVWPEMLPGGRAVLFTILAATGGLDAAQVAVFDLVTHSTSVLVRGGSHAHYVPSGIGSPKSAVREGGHLVYAVGGTLCAVPFDLPRLETRGTAVVVQPRLLTKVSGAAEFVVSMDGTLAYVEAPDTALAATGTLVWVDRTGQEEPRGAPARRYFQPRVSPDGARVAVAVDDKSIEIWVWDVVRRTLTPLTSESAFSPVWTRDGHSLLFFSLPRAAGLFRQPTDGIGPAHRIDSGIPSDVTPDGTRVVFSPGARDIMVMGLDAARPVPLVQTPFNERNGVVSPDGHWLAYEADNSGRFEIYVRPFADVSEGQRLISTAGGTRPLWASSGRELFYVAADGALAAVGVDPRGGVWSNGNPIKVVQGPYSTLSSQSPRTYDVSRDGTRFLVVKEPATQIAAQIVVDPGLRS